ncbi:unnamed protein product [Merluccius merluccius]
MSIDSLGLTLHDGASSSDEDEMRTRDGGGSGEWRALRALARRAASVQEQHRAGLLDGFLTLGLDPRSSYSGPPEPTEPTEPGREGQRDPKPGPHAFNTGPASWRPGSSLRARAQEHLVSTVMENSQRRPTGDQHRSAPPTARRDVSMNRPGLSGSPRFLLSGRSTPAQRPAPPEDCGSLPFPPSPSRPSHPSLSRPGSGGASSRPVSRAAQEILGICGIDRAGGEDLGEDAAVDADALTRLEQELRLMVDARLAHFHTPGCVHNVLGSESTEVN